MSPEDAKIVADLAQAAAREALEAIQRKAKLGFTPRMRNTIVATAMAIVEAQCRMSRELLGDQKQGELVDQLATDLGTAAAKAGFAELAAALRAAGASRL